MFKSTANPNELMWDFTGVKKKRHEDPPFRKPQAMVKSHEHEYAGRKYYAAVVTIAGKNFTVPKELLGKRVQFILRVMEDNHATKN